MQDIKSDKPSGLRYQTGREGKLKQGVRSDCRYPHSAPGNAKQLQEEKMSGGLGINPRPGGCRSRSGSGADRPLHRARSCLCRLERGLTACPAAGCTAQCPVLGALAAARGPGRCDGSVRHRATPGQTGGREGGEGKAYNPPGKSTPEL